ncbi:MAG TPA: hypothetical protein VEU62_23255, partial [Bryobacterales bacterium]|nr:hypothetical protein [Bryobacterales bacterium]
GIFLITRAMGLSDALALACAGVYALGGMVRGPSVLLMEYEPIPRAFALGPAVLAIGLAAERRYFAAGVAGAVAFLLHATTCAPFWIVFAVLLFVPDEPQEMKKRLWALLPLAVAAIGLKVAAALQPGVTEPQALLDHIDPAWEKLLRMRAAYLFVDVWPRIYFWQYGLMLVTAAAAYWRLRRFLQPTLRFFVVGLAALGVLSLPVSWLLLEKWKWAMVAQTQPLRTILFLELFTLLLALVMAFELACREGRLVAAVWWAALAFSISIDARLLFVLTPLALGWLAGPRAQWGSVAAAAAVAWAKPFGSVFWRGADRSELLIAVALAALLVAASALLLRRPRVGALALVAVVAAAFVVIPGGAQLHWSGKPRNPDLDQLSAWARAATPLRAVFLFPDAERSSFDPGIFRAQAERALYVDWKGGGQMNFFQNFSRIWGARWEQTLAVPFQPAELPHFRELGISYVGLSTSNRLPDRKPAFENKKYAVYRLD